MVIETDARRHIVSAIKIEQQMAELEVISMKKGTVVLSNSKEFNNLRVKLIENISEINAVANTTGKGRDDFDIKVLLKAEEIHKKSTGGNLSKAARKISESIKTNF